MSEKLKTQQDNTMTFKIGDRVRLTDDNHGFGRLGALGEIITVNTGDYEVRFDEEFCGGTDWFVGNNIEKAEETKTNPFSWSGSHSVDPDLSRGYAEECSEYRACKNERGDWIVEATRRKIIAQAADETEARRIADALNTTINN